MSYRGSKKVEVIVFKRAQNDAKRLKKSQLKAKAEALLDIIEADPLQSPPPVKKLVGDYTGYYSRRINIQHRLVYAINAADHTIRVISMWHHYND